MIAESQFTPAHEHGRPVLGLAIPGGVVKVFLSADTPQEKVGEICEYLNLIVEEVTFRKTENMEPDLERLNEEQPVSVAVVHT